MKSGTARRPSWTRPITSVAGWLAVFGWVLAPCLAWQGYWLGITFLGSAPTAHDVRMSNLYLTWAAALGIGLPIVAVVLGRLAGNRSLTIAGLLEGALAVVLPLSLVVLLLLA